MTDPTIRFGLAGRSFIITGAAQGIGEACARRLVADGARVALWDLADEAGRALAAELGASSPGGPRRALYCHCNVALKAEVDAALAATLAAFGRVDGLVNNAGQDFNSAVEEIDPGDYRSILELNLVGALTAMQAVIPHMRRQGSGAIVNVSSGTTKMILTGSAGYSSSKAALNHLSLVAREELAPDGITVSVIYPYITETDLEKNAVGADEASMAGPPPGIPPADPPEKVAEAILSLLESGDAELSLVPRRG